MNESSLIKLAMALLCFVSDTLILFLKLGPGLLLFGPLGRSLQRRDVFFLFFIVCRLVPLCDFLDKIWRISVFSENVPGNGGSDRDVL